MKNFFFVFLLASFGQLCIAKSLNLQPVVGTSVTSCASIIPLADYTVPPLIPLLGTFTATINGVVCRLKLKDNGVGTNKLGSLSGTCFTFPLDNGIVADSFSVSGTYVPWTSLNPRYLIEISGAGSKFDPKGESATAPRIRFFIATVSGFAESTSRDAPLSQFTSFITTTKDIRGLGKEVTFSQPVVWRRN